MLLANNDSYVYAVDAGTGKLRWRTAAVNEVMTQPVYEGDIAFVGAGNSGFTFWGAPFYKLIGAGPSELLALHVGDGSVLWRVQLPGTGMPTPALVGPALIHGNGAGIVFSVDRADGSYRWGTYLHSDLSMSQILDDNDGRIYLAASYPNGVFALSTERGTVAWRHLFATYDGAFSDCPLASDGKALYAMYVRQIRPMQQPFRPYLRPATQRVYALAKDGTLRWDIELPNVRGIIPAKNEAAIPLLYAGSLYVGSGLAPVVSALDPKSGKVKWQARLRGIMQGGMSAVNGIVYAADSAGYLWALDARTGLTIGSVKTDLSFNVASPVILNESLVIGSRNGTVIAIPLRAIRQSLQVAGVTEAPPDVKEWVLYGIAAVLLLTLIVRLRRQKKPVH